MGQLLSCPFCRELYAEDEGRICPDCDLPLVPLHQLPLSREGQAEAMEAGVDPAEDQQLPLSYPGRGRAPLLALSVLGLALFWAPWIALQRPDPVTLSGFDLASRAPWLFGGAIGWFILAPLVATRRTVNQLRGIRVVAVLFCAMTAGEVALLLLRPPQSEGYFSVGLAYQWGLYASGLCALTGASFAARLGGSLSDLRDLPVEVPTASRSELDRIH